LWQYRGFSALQWVMERLPRRLGYALAIVVARVAFIAARTARRRTLFNLRRALPELSEPELVALTYRNFRNHSKAYADLMRLPRMRVEELRPLLVTEGNEHLESARSHGRGVFVISAHMGSWEIAAAIWSATVAPVSLFAEVLEPPELYDWYRRTRARLGISVLPLTQGGLRQVFRALDANEMVITAVDRDVLGTGRMFDFFGHPARIPTGPVEISLRRGTPILPVCVFRLPDDRLKAVGLPPILEPPTGDRSADVERVTSRLLRDLEGFIREHPDQWHLPHRIWEDSP
jgi:lauroyl/myristoyl acyltransferase